MGQNKIATKMTTITTMMTMMMTTICLLLDAIKYCSSSNTFFLALHLEHSTATVHGCTLLETLWKFQICWNNNKPLQRPANANYVNNWNIIFNKGMLDYKTG
jgi:hypothetical protein